MKYKINLHCHTHFSDGANTVEEMAQAQHDLGFNTCVITDHVYCEDRSISNSLEKFKLQLQHKEKAEKSVGIPIILGIELSVNRQEECLIFGTDAIIDILTLRHDKISNDDEGVGIITIDDIKEVKSKHDCIVILCHPQLPTYAPNFIDVGGADILDGFEIINSGQNWFKHRPVPSQFDDIVAICSSDAHSTQDRDLGRCYMYSDNSITNETELIKHIKSKSGFEFYNKFRNGG